MCQNQPLTRNLSAEVEAQRLVPANATLFLGPLVVVRFAPFAIARLLHGFLHCQKRGNAFTWKNGLDVDKKYKDSKTDLKC